MNDLARLESDLVDSCVVVHIDGEVDASNAPALTEEIAGLIEGRDAGLVIDLSGTKYLDSAAIRMLFTLRARLESSGGAIWVAVPADSPTRQVLDIAEVAQLIPIVESVDEAVRRASGA